MLGRAVLFVFVVTALASANGCCYCHSNDWGMLNVGFMGCQACDCRHGGGLLGFGLLGCCRDRCGSCNGDCGGCGECGGCGSGSPLFGCCSRCGDGCGGGCWRGGSHYPDMGCSGICWDGCDDCGCDPCDDCGNWCGGHAHYNSGTYSEGWSDDMYAANGRGRRGEMMASKPTPGRQYAARQTAPPEDVTVEGERFTGRPRYTTAAKTKSVMQPASQNHGRSPTSTARQYSDEPRY